MLTMKNVKRWAFAGSLAENDFQHEFGAKERQH
jgi:hypothetical protein